MLMQRSLNRPIGATRTTIKFGKNALKTTASLIQASLVVLDIDPDVMDRIGWRQAIGKTQGEGVLPEIAWRGATLFSDFLIPSKAGCRGQKIIQSAVYARFPFIAVDIGALCPNLRRMMAYDRVIGGSRASKCPVPQTRTLLFHDTCSAITFKSMLM